MTKDITPLGSPKSAAALIEMYYLDLRSALIETAAGFDRIQRADGGAVALKDKRIEQLRQACTLLQQDEPDRAEAILNLLSVEP